MGKSSGGTRASSATSPKGISAPQNRFYEFVVPPTSDKEAQEEIAERAFAQRLLRVDPGDAVYEEARNLYDSSITDSIENMTDYFAYVVRGDTENYVRIQSSFTSPAAAIRDYGTEMVDVPMGNRSLMDIIRELQQTRESEIFRKYR